ncbi:MAG: hypothetical protein A2605_03435 [Candidatus Zambryskibacteria bacterium RIFOXYD1_FULL_39_35]|nr:MAG: hypothetical protein A2605_03435 [Candidatus Zambryskibacteria bacterium RIFOXYD1_FULL_39_35]
MESKQKFVTDLTDRSNDIIILQPAVTAGMRKFADLSRILRRNSSLLNTYDWERCVWETVSSIEEAEHFVHTGTLKTRSARMVGSKIEEESLDYLYCGNLFEASVDHNGCLAWHCENCKTKMRFFHIKRDRAPNILLHLLLKQMIPTLRTCNYIWTEKTGVISVLDNALAYKPDSQGDAQPSWKAGLGFTFMPGMHTLENLGGFDEWLRYLVQIKFDQLQEVAESQLPRLIGPKHMGELNRGLRFWRE